MRLFAIILFMLISTLTRAQLTTEWEVTSINTGKGFKDIQILSDGSIMAQLIYCSSRSDLPGNFYDAAKKAIPYDNNYRYDHQLEKHKTLIKFNQQGVYQWSNSYQNKDYQIEDIEFDFVGYKVMRNDQIVVLVKYNEVYFQKLDDEKKKKAYYDKMQRYYDSIRTQHPDEEYYGEEEYYDGEYYEEHAYQVVEDENVESSEEAAPEKNRSMYALQFLNPSTGALDSMLFMPHLNACSIEIYNLEKTINNTLVLAGVTSSQTIAIRDSLFIDSLCVYNENPLSGSFVAKINIANGDVLWTDFISHTPTSYYYFHPSENHHYLSVSNDGTIYFSSEHCGEAIFSNQMRIKSDAVNEQYSSQWVYLVSYSDDGKINWIKNNRNYSSIQAVTNTDRGVYIAQYSLGKQSFDLSMDTTNAKYVCLSFINKEGKEMWVVNFPNATINSIQMDHNNLPVIQGAYNGNGLRTTKFQINENLRLNDEHDFFIIRLKNNGVIYSVFTDNLWLQDLSYSVVPTFTLTKPDEAYLTYHTQHWFTKEEREKNHIHMADHNSFADQCKLVKINLKKAKIIR